MKKLLPPFALIALLFVFACKKEKTTTLPPIEPMDITMPSVVFPLTNLPIEWNGMMQFKAVPINLDSIVRARSANKFTQEHVRSITVKSINAEMLNADSDNNLANFSRLEVFLVIKNVDDHRLQGSQEFGTTFANASALQPGVNNLKQAIDSIAFKSFMYTIYGRVRKNTDARDMKVDIVYHLE